MKKKISIITLFMLCLWCAVIGAQAKEEPFSGSRETKCVISQSDLNNFISGGKTSLEMLLVQTKEEWFELYSKPKGTEVELYLKYSFASYEDYKTKTEQLLGYEPITTYGEEEEAYAENFSPRDLFHFLMQQCRRLLLWKKSVFVNCCLWKMTK